MKFGQTGRSRILVVDDEPIIALTLSTILKEEGYEVATAFTGEEAVEKAVSFLPDLLLSDIAMGDLNGMEAAVRITASLPNCRVLFLSGHASLSDMRIVPPENLVYSFMSKPARLPDLLNAIAYMLPAAGAAGDKAAVKIEHDPMQLHTLARTALMRLCACRTAQPGSPTQALAQDVASVEAGRCGEIAGQISATTTNGEGWFHAHKRPLEDARQSMSSFRTTSAA